RAGVRSRGRASCRGSSRSLPSRRETSGEPLAAQLPPGAAPRRRVSGHRVAHRADAVVVHLDFAVLLADQRADIGRQILLQRLFIDPFGGILASLALIEHGMFVHPGDPRADIDPEAVQLPGHRAAALGIAAQLADFLLQLRGAEPATLGLLLEKRLQLRVFDRVRAGAKTLFAVLAGLDQIIKRADDIIAVHRPSPFAARRGRGANPALPNASTATVDPILLC